MILIIVYKGVWAVKSENIGNLLYRKIRIAQIVVRVAYYMRVYKRLYGYAVVILYKFCQILAVISEMLSDVRNGNARV